MNFSFLHVADIHLGREFSDLSKYSYDESVLNLYKNGVENSLKKMIDFAIQKQVDFVLIAGDTFDSEDRNFSLKLFFKKALNELTQNNIKVFMICGNHDPIISYNKSTFNYDENSEVKIIGLNTDYTCKLPILNKDNEQIAILRALSFKTDKLNENPTKYFEKADLDEKKYFNICLLHCDLNADKSSPYAPCSVSELKELDYNYYALGHIHLPNNYDDNIFYSGTIQGRNTKESSVHGFRYVQVENNNIINNQFVSSDIVRYEDIEVDITSSSDTTSAYELAFEKLKNIIQTNDQSCEKFLVRLSLTGYIDFYEEINSDFFDGLNEKIKYDLSSKVYISQFNNLLKKKVDKSVLISDDGIAGEIVKTLEENMISDKLYEEVMLEVKNVISKCEFNEEDLDNLKELSLNSAKQYCLNLCSNIFENSEGKDE